MPEKVTTNCLSLSTNLSQPACLPVCLLAADLYFFRGLPCHGLCWEEVKLHRVVELCKQTLTDRLTTIITYFATSLRKRFLFTFLQRYNDSDHAECGGISETIPFSNFSTAYSQII